ncbi:MAG: hypothetical protein H7Z38_18755 [Rubrivivax sp.]|nr:hypothetical protein [Pyrinomonadaceae bacterium]
MNYFASGRSSLAARGEDVRHEFHQETVMQNLRSSSISSSGVNPLASLHAFAPTRSLAACLLALLFCVSVAAQVRPAAQNSSQQPAQGEQKTQSPFDVVIEDESESKEEEARPRVLDPATIMRKARFIRVHSDSVFISEQEIEDSLRKRKEFQAWGMIITRNDADADLIIEVTRKSLTRRFTFTVLDPRTMEVVTSGKTRSVTFGKKISNKIAEKFANRIKVVRPYPPIAGSTP